jgi:crotonobetainyl-CoA:carnitine CoA-transferase CaiB-like acyl-CoA transferase
MYDVLRGVRVVELSTWLFVPSASAVLADWGADVIKVESPVGGDPARGLVQGRQQEADVQPFLEVANRGKRSVAIDVGTPDGVRLLYELVESADVFMTNFLPEARQRLKIDIADIRAVNPRIIYARGSGWGPRGDFASRGGFDLASAWAYGGAAYAMTHEDDDHPAFQAGSFGDLTGGLAAAGAVAAALFRREQRGVGSVVDVALLSVGMWMMSQLITAAPLGMGYPIHRRTSPTNPVVNAYRTQDRRWLFLVFLQSDPYWADLCAHLERSDLLEDARFRDSAMRGEHSEELTEILDTIFAQKTLEEWTERLRTLKGVWAPALSPEEIARDAQVSANGFMTDLDHPTVSMSVVASPAQFDEAKVGPLRASPAHGQHTEEVLLELGHSWDDIAQYKESGAVL